MTTLLETSGVSPPPEVAPEMMVPLSYYDYFWLHYHPIRRLLFYQHPCSKSEFLNTIVPKLKESLSLTLKYYLPVSGNLLYPLNTENKPVLRYISGDSVPLTIAESVADFDELTGNHQRPADQFYDFVPEMPPIVEESEYKSVPVIALQVTLFPGRGICVGLANHHVLGDARSIVGLMTSWASINKHGGNDEFLTSSPPNFDRSLIDDPHEIDTKFWNTMRNIPIKSSSFPLPTNRVRATYTLHQSDIKKLKNLVLSKKPGLVQVSSFVVTTTYIWSCLVKSGDAVGETADEKAIEMFGFPADARGRTNPPVPENYFGNCLGGGLVRMEHAKLVEEDGFVSAAEIAAGEIKNRVNNKDEILNGVENWLSEMGKFKEVKLLGISGSPKFDLSDVDFGFGKVKKLEVVSIDGENHSMSMCKSRVSEGGLEVGLSLPEERMLAFAAIFADGLKF